MILNLSAIDYGGAGKFAVDFSRLLRESGLQSYLVVKDLRVGGEATLAYQDSAFDNSFSKFRRRAYKKKLTDNVFAYDYYFYNKYETLQVVSAQKILALIPKKPDVIFIHWVTDFINTKVIHELKRLTNAKIYWLVIDNAPLTGGCHYSWTCDGYTRACSACPAILMEQYKWIAEKNLAYKKEYLPDDLRVITFSQSDFIRAKQSALFRDKHVVKLLGFVDERKFIPGDKETARRYFGVPTNQKVLFFGASSLKEKRKGMQLLLDALAVNPTDDITLLIAGEFPSIGIKGNVKKLGYLSVDELIIAYQAADAFICPSLEDSGPMMINQSLMCGTPVIAFNIGVAQDLVITGETGYKVMEINSSNLAEGINAILSMSSIKLSDLSTNCRIYAERQFSQDTYLKAIRSLLSQSIHLG